MRRYMLTVGLCSAILFATKLSAQNASPPVPSEPAVEDALAGQSADLPPRGSSANRWRYSFHQGHWWYYRDGGRWSYWTGKEWRDYEPKSYARWHVKQKMADYDARLARFDARWMQPYMSDHFTDGYSGFSTLNYRGPATTTASPWSAYGGVTSGIFTPHAYDGRLNPATSVGGYMGGALRGPFGY